VRHAQLRNCPGDVYHQPMRTALRHKLFGFCLTIMLMVALGSVGLAHRVSGSAAVARDAFVLAGGDLTEFCGGANDDGQAARTDCPACHLVKAFDLPRLTFPYQEADLRWQAVAIVTQADPVVWHAPDPAHRLRAPPVA
jgi:hypothetical protein